MITDESDRREARPWYVPGAHERPDEWPAGEGDAGQDLMFSPKSEESLGFRIFGWVMLAVVIGACSAAVFG